MDARELLELIKQSPDCQPITLPATVCGSMDSLDDYRRELWLAIQLKRPTRIVVNGWQVMSQIHYLQLDGFIQDAFFFMLQLPVSHIHFDFSDVSDKDHIIEKVFHFLTLTVMEFINKLPNRSYPLMTCLTIKHYHSDEATAKQWNLKFIALSNQPRVDNAIPSACLLSLAENYKTEQWYGAALSAYQDAYCLDKRLICVPYQEANIFYQMQCYEETIERLNRAIINGLINGDNDLLTKAYYLRANVYKECGVNADNLINAKNDFLALCDISPNYLDAKIGLEECEEALKKINECSNDFITPFFLETQAFFARALSDCDELAKICERQLGQLKQNSARLATPPLLQLQGFFSRTANSFVEEADYYLQSLKDKLNITSIPGIEQRL